MNAVLVVDLARSGVSPGLHTLKLGVIEPDGREAIRESPLEIRCPSLHVKEWPAQLSSPIPMLTAPRASNT